MTRENIQGTWTLETATVDGKTMPIPPVVYVFAGETLTIHPKAGKEEKTTFRLNWWSFFVPLAEAQVRSKTAAGAGAGVRLVPSDHIGPVGTRKTLAAHRRGGRRKLLQEELEPVTGTCNGVGTCNGACNGVVSKRFDNV